MKRIISLILSLMLIVSIISCVSASEFSDLDGHWAKEVMLKANENGLLFGSNGKMDPDGLLTRAHIAAIVTRAFGATAECDWLEFSDLPEGAWYTEPVLRAVAMGIMTGRGNISPNEQITRQETFGILAAALKLSDGDVSALNAFSDANEVGEWARGTLAAMAERGYIKGDNGKLKPNDTITRAEFAALFSQIFETIVSEGNLSTSIAGNLLINGNGVTLNNCTITGDLIIADGVSNIDLNAVYVEGRILVRGGNEAVNLSGSTTATQSIIVATNNGIAKLNNMSSMATSSVDMRSEAHLSGNFTDVKTIASMTLTSGIIRKLEANIAGITITNEQNGIINYLYANHNDIALLGSGYNSVILADGVTGVTVNGNPLIASIVSDSLTGYY